MRISGRSIVCLTLFLMFFLSACSKRPILHPNGRLQKSGKVQANKDIKYCMKWARKSGVMKNSSVDEAKKSGEDYTKSPDSMEYGGAANSFLFGIFNRDPKHYQYWVNRCLREKGYDPIAWK